MGIILDFNSQKYSLHGRNDVIKETLVFTESVHHQIIDLINNASKIELIGIGFGNRDSPLITMNKFVQLENLDRSEYTFSLDYEVLLKEITNHEKEERILLGFFHTHPHSSRIYPSEKDRFFMKYWPYPYLWMIGGRKKSPILRIFSLYENKIIEISYRLMRDSQSEKTPYSGV